MNHSSNDLEWTGERYLPDMDLSVSGAEIHYEHLHRYSYASQLVKSKKVLDLACGEGYGSFLMSRDADHVTGIDIDPRAVKHARRKYPKNNIDFIEGSILEIPIREEKIFDVIVCFEAIEHIKEHDRLMLEIKRLLKDDGLLIISTPNKTVYSDHPGYQNPFHLNELYFNEFRLLLQKYFHHSYFLGQAVHMCSHIWDIQTQGGLYKNIDFAIELSDNVFKFIEGPLEPKYYIAIVSDIEMASIIPTKSQLIDLSNVQQNLAVGYIKVLEQAIAGRNNQIASLEQAAAERNNQIASLEQAIADRNGQMLILNDKLNATLSESRALKIELDGIKNSMIWRLTTKYHNGFVERFLHPGTRRRKAYDGVLKFGRSKIK